MLTLEVENKTLLLGLKPFRLLNEYVNLIVKGNIHGLFVSGEGGISKTYSILEYLELCDLKKEKDFVVLSGSSTALEFYHFVYNNREKLIVFDDVDKLLKNSKIISMLKSLLWSVRNERTVSYLTTSPLLEAPSSFEFKGKIVIISNEPYSNNSDVLALKSRAFCYEMVISYEQKIKILELIAKNKVYKSLTIRQQLAVVRYIQSVTSPFTKNLNIRSLIKAFEMRIYSESNWKSLILELFETDDELSVIASLTKLYPFSVKKQISEWINQTAKSRASYFRGKQKLKSLKVS